MKNNIKGVGVALVTPFTTKDEIDFSALERLVDHVSDGGVDYLVALGTTAETPTLTKDEKSEVIACVKRANKRGLPLVIGVGGNNTAEVVNCLDHTDLSGAAAVLSVTPYYNRPSQQGLYEHYKVVARESPLPVMLYNVPSRTGVNMTAETTLRLAHEVDNLVGIKEACAAMSQMAAILRGRPEGFMVVSGDDCMTLPLLSYGGDGVISVAANAYPQVFMQMYRAAIENRREDAAMLQLRLLQGIEALFEEGNPTGIKSALFVKGIIPDRKVRLPLVEGSDALVERLKSIIAEDKL